MPESFISEDMVVCSSFLMLKSPERHGRDTAHSGRNQKVSVVGKKPGALMPTWDPLES